MGIGMMHKELLNAIIKGLIQFLKKEKSNTVGQFNLAFSFVLLILIIIAFFHSLVEKIVYIIFGQTPSALASYMPYILIIFLMVFVYFSMRNIPSNLPDEHKVTAIKKSGRSQ